MNEFSIAVDSLEFDLGLTLTSGQTFVWRQIGNEWVGAVRKSPLIIEQKRNEIVVHTELLKRDVEDFLQLGVSDEFLEDIDSKYFSRLKKWSHLRMLHQPNPVEVLFSFMCTSNNHLKRIEKMVRYLVEKGEVVGEWHGTGIYSFPHVDVIAGLEPDELREAGFGYRAEQIIGTARSISDSGGEAWFRSLTETRYLEVRHELLNLPGIGPKLADCICLYGFGFGESVPVDIHVWRAYCREFEPEWMGSSVTSLRYEQIGNDLRKLFGVNAGRVQQLIFFDELFRGTVDS